MAFSQIEVVGIIVKRVFENFKFDSIIEFKWLNLKGGSLLGHIHHLEHLPPAASSDLHQLLRRHVPDEDVSQSPIQLPLTHLLLGRQDQLTIRVVVELVLLLPSLGADLEHLLFEGLR